MTASTAARYGSGSPMLDELAEAARFLADGLATAVQPKLSQPHQSSPLRLVVEGGGVSGDPIAEAARSYLLARRARNALFPPHLFGDPAWDILLDLFVCQAEGRRFAVSDACVAASVPPTTALRWVSQLLDHDLVVRRPDPCDGRRAYVTLTAPAQKALAAWLSSTFCIEGAKSNPAADTGER